ncbi:MAG: cysteine--tRNA ligase, partial [Candidatus Aminicenantes bacterium]|nr:cysteine--tRNA ligase [Candidatus Aminicenantes bacterium]
MIQLFNTLTGRKEPFVPLTPGEVKMYTCGPTVYDFAHVGNFRAYLFEDLLKRFLVFSGFKVIHVMNITDIDDKTIRGAKAQGVDLNTYTQKYIDAFFSDLKILNVALADRYPRATEHIPEMVAIVKRLIEKGFAYEKEGSYYFSIAKFPAYGRLSKINRDELQPGQRVDRDEYEKENVHDFALWKAKKEDEPFWETEIGPGRPGWHIECSAMSSRYLGETFDIHCGGVDNIFPHHENEIAQSEASSGKKFVHYWLHCHHLIRDGEKMSKSKGNTITIPEILKVKDNPAALRFLLLSTHYRKTLNFTFEALDQAEAALNRINEFAGEVKSGDFPEGETPAVGELVEETEQKFRDGLGDDLNISVAVTAVFNMIKKSNSLIRQGRVKKRDAEKLFRFLQSINLVLGVISPTIKLRASVTVQADVKPRLTVTPGSREAEPQLGITEAHLEKIQLREKA